MFEIDETYGDLKLEISTQKTSDDADTDAADDASPSQISFTAKTPVLEIEEKAELAYQPIAKIPDIDDEIEHQSIKINESGWYNNFSETRALGRCGLQNLGNTCFMNSAIQCLSNVPMLCDYFISDHYRREVMRRENLLNLSRVGSPIRCNLVRAYAELMKQMWLGTSRCVRPLKLKYVIGALTPRFCGYAQQDAHELMSFLMDGLHKELITPNPHRCDKKKTTEQLLPNIVTEQNSCQPQSDKSITVSVANEEALETADSGHSSEGDSNDSDLARSNNNSIYNDALDEVDERENQNTVDEIKESIISLLFDGELISSVKCLTCQHISSTNECFQVLSLSIPSIEQLEHFREDVTDVIKHVEKQLPASQLESTDEGALVQSTGYLYWLYSMAKEWFVLPWVGWMANFYRYIFTGSISLESCIKVFFSTDHLHGEDMYSCENCRKLRNGVKQSAITKLPEVICIHLKRFRHENTYNSKITTSVTFPMCDLDFSPFMDESIAAEEISTTYDLIGIISHRGSGTDYGHYVAFCRNELDKKYEFDDETITLVSEQEVISREAYVLFYEKIH